MLPIETRALVYSIDGQRLINGIDLTLDVPGITIIMGPNGAGKSLLLRLLNGLIAPDSGSVSFAGVPLSGESRQHQAMVFQKPVLLRRSVQANIDFVLNARGLPLSHRDSLLQRVDLVDKAQQPARLLSGGEQQRLALARALATQPDVLFLDEPTASLDPASVLTIESIVADTCKAGTKVIFVTHDLGQAKRLADDVVFLHKGRVAEHQLKDAFFTAPESEVAQAYVAGRIFV